MKKLFSTNRQLAFYLMYFLLAGAVIARMTPHYLNTRYQWLIIALFFMYILFLTTERLISHIFKPYFYIYSVLQVAIVVGLLFIPSYTAPQDYFMNLMIPLCGQAIWNLPNRPGKYLVVLFSAFCMFAMVVTYPNWEGISFGFTYIVGCLLVSVLSAATQNSHRAQLKSQALLDELQTANKKLMDFTMQVEQLAAAEERNRLARELHDSVSQTIFSMTLTAQAARILQDKEPGRVPPLLDHLQTLSQNALFEMRTLIQELRPHSIVEKGLVETLRKHVAERQERDGLSITLEVLGDQKLSVTTEEGIFRIVQEALNNVVKHAQSKIVQITLDMQRTSISLIIEDDGIGFDTNTMRHQAGHFGLSSMEERVKSLGGNIAIISKPGQGTRITIENIQADGGEDPNRLAAASELPHSQEV